MQTKNVYEVTLNLDCEDEVYSYCTLDDEIQVKGEDDNIIYVIGDSYGCVEGCVYGNSISSIRCLGKGVVVND